MLLTVLTVLTVLMALMPLTDDLRFTYTAYGQLTLFGFCL